MYSPGGLLSSSTEQDPGRIRGKQWQKHRVSTAPLKRQNSFVHVVGSHARCAGISCWYYQRGTSTTTAAPYAPPLSAQKWIPTARISTRSSPASSPDTDAPKGVGYGRKRCNCRCACRCNASVAGACWITCS